MHTHTQHTCMPQALSDKWLCYVFVVFRTGQAKVSVLYVWMHVICLLISAPLEVSGKYLSSVGGTKFCICASRCAWGELCVWGVSLLELWLKCKLCSVFLVCLVVNLKDLHASDLSLSLSVSPPPHPPPLSVSVSLFSPPLLSFSPLSLSPSLALFSPLLLSPPLSFSLSLSPLSLVDCYGSVHSVPCTLNPRWCCVVCQAILCTRGVGERARDAAYHLIVEIAQTMMRWNPDAEEQGIIYR